MKLKLRETEILINKEEAEKIGEALLEGVGFFKIGSEVINSKYVIGVFESSEVEPQTERLIGVPKPEKKDIKRIGEILEEMAEELKKRGIIKK